jgi:hypothetical protein
MTYSADLASILTTTSAFLTFLVVSLTVAIRCMEVLSAKIRSRRDYSTPPPLATATAGILRAMRITRQSREPMPT